jgi:hypothetical protein
VGAAFEESTTVIVIVIVIVALRFHFTYPIFALSDIRQCRAGQRRQEPQDEAGHCPMRPLQRHELCGPRTRDLASDRDGREVRRDRAAAAGHETADVHELDPGTQRG